PGPGAPSQSHIASGAGPLAFDGGPATSIVRGVLVPISRRRARPSPAEPLTNSTSVTGPAATFTFPVRQSRYGTNDLPGKSDTVNSPLFQTRMSPSPSRSQSADATANDPNPASNVTHDPKSRVPSPRRTDTELLRPMTKSRWPSASTSATSRSVQC